MKKNKIKITKDQINDLINFELEFKKYKDEESYTNLVAIYSVMVEYLDLIHEPLKFYFLEKMQDITVERNLNSQNIKPKIINKPIIIQKNNFEDRKNFKTKKLDYHNKINEEIKIKMDDINDILSKITDNGNVKKELIKKDLNNQKESLMMKLRERREKSIHKKSQNNILPKGEILSEKIINKNILPNKILKDLDN